MTFLKRLVTVIVLVPITPIYLLLRSQRKSKESAPKAPTPRSVAPSVRGRYGKPR